MKLNEKYGPWALITGASSGIGSELARRIAADGVNVVIAARRLDRLESLAAEIGAEHNVQVRPVKADLTSQDGIDAIEKAVADIDLAIVVNNAGSAAPGAFLRSGVEDQLRVVDLNVKAPIQLAHLLGERLVSRGQSGRGGERRSAMIFTGSTSAFSGVPMLAGYAATKAFVGTFAEGLHGEWKKHGVDVLVVHPGPTRTEMVEMDGVDFNAMPMNWMTAEKVADKTIGSLGRKAVLIPGATNKVQRIVFTRLMPRRLTTRIWGALTTRMTDEDLR